MITAGIGDNKVRSEIISYVEHCMSSMACQDGMSSVICRLWHIEYGMSSMVCLVWHVEYDMSSMEWRVWYVNSYI